MYSSFEFLLCNTHCLFLFLGVEEATQQPFFFLRAGRSTIAGCRCDGEDIE